MLRLPSLSTVVNLCGGVLTYGNLHSNVECRYLYIYTCQDGTRILPRASCPGRYLLHIQQARELFSYCMFFSHSFVMLVAAALTQASP